MYLMQSSQTSSNFAMVNFAKVGNFRKVIKMVQLNGLGEGVVDAQ